MAMKSQKAESTLPFHPAVMLGGLVVLVLWQVLLPGYVFGLDGVPSPWPPALTAVTGFDNGLPWRALNWALYLLLPGWAAQKVVIVALLAALVALPYLYLPLADRRARLWAAVFYLVNPFVYARFLSGQLGVLFGYAFILPLVVCAVRYFWGGGERRDLWKALAWLFGIGCISIHYLAIGGLFLVGCGVGARLLRSDRNDWRLVDLAVGAGAFLVASLYWLVPGFLRARSAGAGLSFITSEHATAFVTAGDARLGTTLNVLSLHGFWAEDDVWAGYFLWAKDSFWLWLALWVGILALVAFGAWRAWHSGRDRAFVLAVAVLAACSLVFACGVGDTVFRPLNEWLFAHVGFWRGFRDTTKWSVGLALAYAYFGAMGVMGVMAWVEKRRPKLFEPAFLMALLLPLAFTYPMLGGFSRQVQPVWYPQSWYEAKAAMAADSAGLTVALPWHQYLSLPFNRNRISANPSRAFFGNRVVQSGDMELDGVSGEVSGSLSAKVGAVLRDRGASPEQRLAALRALGLNRAIVIKELMGHDDLDYGWLTAPAVTVVYDSPEISLVAF